MARALFCNTGKPAYRTKADAMAAHPGVPVKRCDRCRFWHMDTKRRKSRRAN